MESDDFCREVAELVDELLQLCQKREKHLLQNAGITSVELRALRFLGEGKRTMRELAKGLRLSPSRVTRVVDSLSRKNLIRREDCPEDRRLCPVSLTDEGAERLRQGEEAVYRFQREATRFLSDEEKAEVKRVLGRFVEAMKRGLAEGQLLS
ncbi:MAG: MarR family winged helix-turn-helix transcriptional regulator [Thermacetogeniaceae bacterium]